MATISRDDLVALTGAPVLDPTGEAIGTVHDVYYDDATGEPEWIGVSTDLPGQGLRVVPVEGAELVGGTVQVPHALEAAKGSPAVQGGAVTPATERALRAYYGLPAPATSPEEESTDEWEASGEDPEIGAREDLGDRLRIEREIPEDPDEGRIGGPEVH